MNSAITCSPAHKYAEDIVAGRIISCRLTKLAAERYFRDLEQADAKGFYFDVDAAQHRIDFYKFCRHSEGKWGGQVFEPEPWQQFIDWNIYGWKWKKNDKRRFRTAYIEVSRKNGKALALDTPILTDNGWATMGEIKSGSVVFDVNGIPTTVINITNVMYDHDCYKITFSDGESIVSDKDHLWVTRPRRTGRKQKGIKKSEWFKTEFVYTTEQIKNSLVAGKGNRCEWNHKLKYSKPLYYPDVELPIPPYTLGAWLGDGNTDSAVITCSSKDLDIIRNIRNDGITADVRGKLFESTKRYALGVTGKYSTRAGTSFRSMLKSCGLLGNKHIPEEYFSAGVQQRIALLQGLMDTDGYCAKNCQCEFSTTKESLRRDFLRLAYGLGIKTSCRKVVTKCGMVLGSAYRIQFFPPDSMPVFRLRRKLDRTRDVPKYTTRSSYRSVCSVEEIKSVPVKCIQVASPTKQFLVGKTLIPTHNSSKIATDGLFMTGFDGEQGSQVFTAACKRDQARIIHRISTRMVKASPALRKTLGTFKDSIFCESMGGTFIPLGQDSKTEDGWNVQTALVDEYHAHPDSTLHDVMRSGMGSREQPLMLIITTAGFDKTSACYQEREYLVGILEGTFDDESYFGIIYTVDDENKWDDETEWARANPNLNISVSLDDMRDMCLKAKNSPSKQNEFKTKKLNIWTETLTRWITSEAWDACGTPVDADGLCGRECVGAFDLSSVSDLTAWALCFKPAVSSDPYRFLFRFFLPQYDLEKRFVSKDVLNQIQNWIRQGFITATPGNSIDYDFVMEQIRSDGERFDIKEIPYDPYNATQVVNELMKDGFELTPFRQGFLTMSPAAKSFEAAVLDKKIAHGNNPVMRWMVACTDVQSDPAGNIKPVKPDRGKSAKRIDGVIASIMSYARAMGNEDTRSVYETRGILVA